MFFALMLVAGCAQAPPEDDTEGRTPNFVYSVVDPAGEGRIVIGDVDQDGKNDLVVHTWSTNRGVDSDGSVTWYRFPD